MTRPQIALIALLVLPFLASCAVSEIAGGLDRGTLSYSAAENAINNGANVKKSFAGQCFLKQAAEQNRTDLIRLFVEKGGVSCFAADAGYDIPPFSLFEYAYQTKNPELMVFCVQHPDASGEPMRTQVFRIAKIIFNRSLSTAPHAKLPGELSEWLAVLEAIEESEILSKEETEEVALTTQNATATANLHELCSGTDASEAERMIPFWVERGADVNGPDEAGNTPIHILCLSRHIRLWDCVEKLIAAGADVNARDAAGNPPILLVAGNNWKGFWIEKLIAAGADLEAVNNEGHTALYIAMDRGETTALLRDLGAKLTPAEATEFLVRTINAPQGDSFGLTTAELLKMGADINVTANGKSALFLAGEKEKPHIEKLLRDSGAQYLPTEIAAVKEKATSGLSAAIRKSDIETLRQCIRNGADLNSKIYLLEEKKYCSPLFFAKELVLRESTPAREQTCALLEESGAVLSQGETEALAVLAKEIEIARVFRLIATGRWHEIAAGVKNGTIDLTITQPDGRNAFHCLASSCRGKIDESFIVALKNLGIGINVKTKNGKSPLALAIENSNPSALAMLLKHGANAKDTVPIVGAFGKVGEKSLMDLAIEVYNQSVDFAKRARHAMAMIEAPSALDISRDADIKVRNAEEVVSRMADATGTLLTEH